MARAAIKNNLPRRSSGMPEEWKRENTSNLPASDADAYSKDKEIAAPVSTTIATSSEDAGQQVFITHKMRNVLEDELGFLPNEVNEMHPEVQKNHEVSKF